MLTFIEMAAIHIQNMRGLHLGTRNNQFLFYRAVINQNATLKKKCAEYREKWEHNEVLLLTSKEECKQACINYQETLEKCTQLEKVWVNSLFLFFGVTYSLIHFCT